VSAVVALTNPQEREKIAISTRSNPSVTNMGWSKSTRITIMLAIDAAFFVLELGVGLVVGSLALMADAFHMVGAHAIWSLAAIANVREAE